MQDTRSFIAEIEADIARTEEALATLERLAQPMGDDPFELTDEMRDAFERFESLCSAGREPTTHHLPTFAIRI